MKRALTILSMVAAPAYGQKICMAKSSDDTMKDLRTLLKCPDANPTDCKCTGNGQKTFDCGGPDKTLWESTGKKCITATSDNQTDWSKHDWPYPANTANDCNGSSGTGANWEPGSYHCTKVLVQDSEPKTYKPHKFEKGNTGYNPKYDSEAWCTQPSCYVDPCTCNMKDFSASSWFKKQDGSTMYFSGMMCKQKYTFKAALCGGKTTSAGCIEDSGCKWVTPAPSPAEKVVKISYTFKQLTFSKLTPETTTAMTTAVKDGVLASLPAGYTKNHIEVMLKSGSVIAEVSVTPLAGTTATTLTTALTSAKQDTMKTAVLTKVKAAAAINTALATGKTMSDLVVTSSAVTITAKPASGGETVSGAWSARAGASLVVIFLICGF